MTQRCRRLFWVIPGPLVREEQEKNWQLRTIHVAANDARQPPESSNSWGHEVDIAMSASGSAERSGLNRPVLTLSASSASTEHAGHVPHAPLQQLPEEAQEREQGMAPYNNPAADGGGLGGLDGVGEVSPHRFSKQNILTRGQKVGSKGRDTARHGTRGRAQIHSSGPRISWEHQRLRARTCQESLC